MSSSSLHGKTCLVTGASSGIGRGICEILAREGATVVGTGRNRDALEGLFSRRVIDGFIVADLTQPGECERVVQGAVEMFFDKRLTAVVNAAGVLQGGAVGSVDLSNYQYNMHINTQVPFEIMTHAVPYLRKSQSSSIINISSVNAKQAFAGCATYCMSKAALDQLTRCASVDLAPWGIRVNAINPGVIETPLQTRGGMSDDAYQAFLEKSRTGTHPIAAALGRVGQPHEIGELVAFLVSDKALFFDGRVHCRGWRAAKFKSAVMCRPEQTVADFTKQYLQQ